MSFDAAADFPEKPVSGRGFDVLLMTSERFSALMRSDIDRMAGLMRRLAIRAD